MPYFRDPPPLLKSLFFDMKNPHSKIFLENIRAYNNMFSFTSMGGKINTAINTQVRGPYTADKITTILEACYQMKGKSKNIHRCTFMILKMRFKIAFQVQGKKFKGCLPTFYDNTHI